MVSVIDSTKAGMDVSQALEASFGKGIPVLRDINEALRYRPDTLLTEKGFSPPQAAGL